MTDHSAVLTALADPTRRQIFERLADRPQPVGELARDLPVSRPAVSQHLKVLQDAGLVRHQAIGARRVYAVDPAGLAALRGYLERFWRRSLDSYKQVAESTHRRSHQEGT
jgi:DNA-binding transcriptional ArsR family regulator